MSDRPYTPSLGSHVPIPDHLKHKARSMIENWLPELQQALLRELLLGQTNYQARDPFSGSAANVPSGNLEAGFAKPAAPDWAPSAGPVSAEPVASPKMPRTLTLVVGLSDASLAWTSSGFSPFKLAYAKAADDPSILVITLTT